MRLILVFLLLVLAPAFNAQSIAQEQQVLVPIAFADGVTLAGAHGTTWVGEVWASNDSTSDIQTLQSQQCQIGCPEPQLPAKSHRTVGLQTAESVDGGALLYIPTSLTSDVSFSARVLEVTRQAQPTGFAVPVIREDEYLETAVVLPGIPRGTGVRSSLRIYDPSGQGGGSFTVELLGENGRIINSFVVTLSAGKFAASTPVTPAYAAVHDLENRASESNGSEDVFHVRVTPTTSGPYWTFASVTDNETQHVLIITAD